MSIEIDTTNLVEHMAEDAARSMFSVPQLTEDDGNAEEEPNIGAKNKYDCYMPQKKPLWEGCTSGT